MILWCLALLCGVAPLWASQAIPLVDLPQHLHLISVLHRLSDATTLYPDFFAQRPELTPYLGYYYAVNLLHWLMPLELANRVFLSVYVAGLPLSLAFLLRSVKRPSWPALLALPFAYGDSLAWGFINYCASIPLAILTCGLFVRAVSEGARRTKWAAWSAVSLVAVLLFHVQAFMWLSVALPWLLLTTPPFSKPFWRARLPALASVAPAVALFVLWIGLRVGQPQEVAPGQPWKSWGPMLSAQNLGWKSFEQNLSEFVSLPRAASLTEVRFPILAGMTPDGADQLAVRASFATALISLVLGLWQLLGRLRTHGLQAWLAERSVAEFRMVGLAALATILFFALPFDIRGYMYYLNTRYAHLMAALLVCAVPLLEKRWHVALTAVGVAVSVLLMIPLRRAFMAFDEESRALSTVSQSAGEKPKVMGLIFQPNSRAVTHPVYLHSSCTVAREHGGITNFSFALTPHSPLMYKVESPPTFPSEWHPEQMRWDKEGQYYDHFLLKGVRADQFFGSRLGSELFVAAQAGDFTLVKRRGSN